MGLDMYLNAERFFWNNEEAPVAPNGLPVKTLRVDAGTWRKANQIHAWFVTHVQGGVDKCEEHYVSREQLSKLRETCQEVLKNPDRAHELLPPQSGFFFGSTDIDEWYIRDVTETVDILDKCLDEDLYPPEDWDFYYRASW